MMSDVNYFLLKTCCYTSAFSFHQVNLFEMLISKSKLVLGGHNFSQDCNPAQDQKSAT
jgi:hypothetical protein